MGDATLELRDIGLDTEHVVVLRSDDEINVSAELMRQWRSGEGRHIHLDGNLVTFGTVGEGLGRLTYEVIYEPKPDDPLFAVEGAYGSDWAILRRRSWTTTRAEPS